ncbi:MAG: hypothetical protein ABJB66_15055 [Gemmatimonadaceae bacterium]
MPDIESTDLQARLVTALAGPCEVLRALGQGGMGTVFLARELTLDREVAVKVISPELAPSPELKQRFSQEARTVASCVTRTSWRFTQPGKAMGRCTSFTELDAIDTLNLGDTVRAAKFMTRWKGADAAL